MNMVGVAITKQHLQEGERKGKAAELEGQAAPAQHPILAHAIPPHAITHGATKQQHGGKHSRHALHPCMYT